ncbi:MAG: hypothetical protein JJT95_06390 [Pararhodobacter sp.]|nr:hypothetical protein [Pararhodobacter sp.]
MFAPPGYIMVGPFLDNLAEEVIDYFYPPSSLLDCGESNHEGPMLSGDKEKNAIDWMNDWGFRVEAVRNWVIHVTLLRVELYVCSISGVVLKVGPYIIERLRDDNMATDGELLTFDPIKSPFEKQRCVYFTGTDIFRFLDIDSGLIRPGFNDETSDQEEIKVSYIKSSSRLMENFAGWAICFSASDVPKTAPEFLTLAGFGETTQALDTMAHKRRRGRPSQRETAARNYYLEFPSGHEREGKTWKEALRTVNKSLSREISEDTLKRAVDEYTQNRQ